MSHLAQYQTEYTNQEALVRALVRLGFQLEHIEVHEKPKILNDYHNTNNILANVIIRKAHSGIPSDVGWELKDGVFIDHTDDYDYRRGSWRATRIYDADFQVKLKVAYNIEVHKLILEQKGRIPIECKLPDGRIQIRCKFLTKKTEQKIKF